MTERAGRPVQGGEKRQVRRNPGADSATETSRRGSDLHRRQEGRIVQTRKKGEVSAKIKEGGCIQSIDSYFSKIQAGKSRVREKNGDNAIDSKKAKGKSVYSKYWETHLEAAAFLPVEKGGDPLKISVDMVRGGLEQVGGIQCSYFGEWSREKA